MAEVSRRWSPYTFCGDNPIRFIDPDGNSWKDYLLGVGKGAVNTVVSSAKGVYNMFSVSPTQHAINTMANVAVAGGPKQYATNLVNGVKQGVTNTINEVKNDKTGGKAGELTGAVLTQVALAAIATKGIDKLGKAGVLGEVASVTSKVTNPVPATLARVVPTEVASGTLGVPNKLEVFVTAASDIRGLNNAQLAKALTIPESSSGFTIFEFPTPAEGLASPIVSDTPGFVGFGRTAGGAREYVIPNGPIPANAVTTTVAP